MANEEGVANKGYCHVIQLEPLHHERNDREEADDVDDRRVEAPGRELSVAPAQLVGVEEQGPVVHTYRLEHGDKVGDDEGNDDSSVAIAPFLENTSQAFFDIGQSEDPVSYTHLTLPTKA